MAIKGKQFLLGVIGAGGQSHTVPAGFVDTVLQCTFHNTSASVATVTATLNSVQILEALPIDPSGNQPTIFRGLLGQRMTAEQVLAFTAGTNDVITVSLSGIRETA